MSPAKGEKLIEVKGLEKHFKHVEVLRGINIDICKGDVVAVIGPSGSGKSTFLRCLNLLEEPTGGQIVFEGVDITSKETKIDQMRQKIGMVFQQFNLFTNMTVLDNVSAGPVLVKGMKRDEAHKLAQSLLERVGLGDRGGAYPIQLSGGQQQRVAIARALAKEPQVLLLDEPLSNLDAKLRVEMREEIRRIQREAGITTIFVTHDQEEASSIADQVVLLREGVLQQRATARELYDEPVNLFAADFLGAPPINKLSATMRGGKILLDGSDISLSLPLKQAPEDGTAVVLAVRAESICLAGQGGASLKAEVKERYSIGKDELVLLQVGQAQQMRGFVPGNEVIREGDCLSITLGQKGVFLFDAQTGERFA